MSRGGIRLRMLPAETISGRARILRMLAHSVSSLPEFLPLGCYCYAKNSNQMPLWVEQA